MIDLLLANARLAGQDELEDLAIHDGQILRRGRGLEISARHRLDLEGSLVVPGFVEPHLHLDIALMNSGQRPGRQQPAYPGETFNASIERRRAAFTHQDIVDRASTALELALRHGVIAVRAQCHVDPTVGLKHLEALLEVKECYAGRVALQIVAFPQQGIQAPHGLDLFREAFRLGADVMGCASNLDPAGRVDFRTSIDTALSLAMEHDVDLDVHADLDLLDDPGLDDLESVYLACRAIETGYTGRITAGHACALDSARREVAGQAIERMREARVHVISQPDLYRLGRQDSRHVRRGLTRVKQLLAAGVNVAFASNNVRDGFRPLGNLNPIEEALVLSYGAHMDTVAELDALLEMCTTNAAQILKLPGYGLEAGCQADLVVLEASSPSDAIVSQAEQRYVFKAGRMLAANQVISQRFV